jgi:hypothetical protein
VRFLTEMKVRDNRVLEKMEDGVAGQHCQRRGGPKRFEALWDQLHKHQREQESRTERKKILLYSLRPCTPLDDKPAPEYFGSRSNQPIQKDSQRHELDSFNDKEFVAIVLLARESL